MICIPYIINDTYLVARLGAQQEAVPYYILEKSENKIELFRFEEKFFAFNPASGMGQYGENDYHFEVVEKACSVKNDPTTHTAEVTIGIQKHHPDRNTAPTKGKATTPVTTSASYGFKTSGGLSLKGNKVFFNLLKVGHSSNCVSTIKVKFVDVDEEEMEYSFALNVTQTENIFHIVIDFGSEASQVWINHRTLEQGNMGNQMPLFENIKDNSTYSADDNERIYQFDPSNPNLFRSLFFIKKEVPKACIEQADLSFINKEDELLDIQKTMVALPNLKLMDHNEVYLPNFKFNGATTNIFTKSSEIRAEILKFFFQTALMQVNRLASNREVACKLTFLVPNTYKQATLSKVYNQLIKDINQLFVTSVSAIDNKEAERYKQIKPGVEVATFSESDASFFGYYQATDYQPEMGNQRFLIIDVGKGTTDFSVLCVKGGVGRIEVERNARSGFVGAGNVMTFAIFVAAVKQLADRLGPPNQSDVYDAIEKIAYGNDSAKKNHLYRHLEQLKRNEHMGGRTSLATHLAGQDLSKLKNKNVKDIDIDKWNEILESACNNNCYVDENDPVIQTYAQLMAKRLVSELKYVFDVKQPIDKVVFSGRGAKSETLKEHIIDSLTDAIKKEFGHELLSDSEIKSGCLKGPLNESLRMDHMNMPIVGWPLQQDFQPRNQGAKNKDEKKEETKRKGFFGSMVDFFNRDSDSNDTPMPADIDEEEELRRELIRIKRIPPLSQKAMSQIQGLPVNINAKGNHFVLGNRRCFIDIDEGQQGEKRIFFDGEEFVARDADASYKFVYEQNSKDDSFITETLFPMTGNSTVRITMTGVKDVLDMVYNNYYASNDEDDFSIGQPDVEYSDSDSAVPNNYNNGGATAFDDDDFAV